MTGAPQYGSPTGKPGHGRFHVQLFNQQAVGCSHFSFRGFFHGIVFNGMFRVMLWYFLRFHGFNGSIIMMEMPVRK